ncbi:hypothetical protein LINGRAHAP2_LOCUS4426, partial [Linum grandiflorum]
VEKEHVCIVIEDLGRKPTGEGVVTDVDVASILGRKDVLGKLTNVFIVAEIYLVEESDPRSKMRRDRSSKIVGIGVEQSQISQLVQESRQLKVVSSSEIVTVEIRNGDGSLLYIRTHCASESFVGLLNPLVLESLAWRGRNRWR